jgi:hypothetical protein
MFPVKPLVTHTQIINNVKLVTNIKNPRYPLSPLEYLSSIMNDFDFLSPYSMRKIPIKHW